MDDFFLDSFSVSFLSLIDCKMRGSRDHSGCTMDSMMVVVVVWQKVMNDGRACVPSSATSWGRLPLHPSNRHLSERASGYVQATWPAP